MRNENKKYALEASIFHQPLLNISRFSTKVYTNLKKFSRIRFKWSGIVFVIDLLQSFFRRTIQFKFHDVDELVGL